jgi:hypothetical protein
MNLSNTSHGVDDREPWWLIFMLVTFCMTAEPLAGVRIQLKTNSSDSSSMSPPK